ncbi:Kelch repeat-containing protein [Hibiscus syriacus]|uniref:Kelch repeat-containing protein n=1 Tax=Hibiscus syriacus TaxID=106335 RepID=A0A6A3BQB1_HIBSY|nr:Kelch repeat-containing protein [Hibiscus syriacus]
MAEGRGVTVATKSSGWRFTRLGSQRVGACITRAPSNDLYPLMAVAIASPIGNKKGHGSERLLSTTFVDLPTPELPWEQMPSAPVARFDGSAIQIKNLFYVLSGYGTLDYVDSHVEMFNFTDNTWCAWFYTPKDMANSHLGVATDGRYIYVVSGQYGLQCRSPTARTQMREWRSMPPLPVPRHVYAPATQLWRGRLHVMGGSKENRHTPGLEHWTIAVKDGRALEKEWQTEIPIPRGGLHRACIVVNDQLFVIGGQEGDLMANPGSPIFKCSRRHEFDHNCRWYNRETSSDQKDDPGWGGFPVPLSFTDYTFGKLPYRVKTTLAGFWDGYLYFTSGQRDRGMENPQPKKVIGEMWRTQLNI